MDSTVHSRSSSQPVQTLKTRAVCRNIVQGRKTWKRTTDGERVWPPEAEEALLEGLENYRPEQSRETMILGRFRMRNRYIAQHILNKTGIIRTPKQVGSRLQQLRESCEDPHLQKLLSPFRDDMPSPSSDRITDPIQYVHYIDVLFPGASYGLDFNSENGPRSIQFIDPNIAFVTQTTLTNSTSLFTVEANGEIVHSEETQLQAIHPIPVDAQGFVYSTRLVPRFWPRLCQSSDPAKYTIHQDVVNSQRVTLSRRVYKFRYIDNAMASASQSDVLAGPWGGSAGPSPTTSNFSLAYSDRPSPLHSSDGGYASGVSDDDILNSSVSACFPNSLDYYI